MKKIRVFSLLFIILSPQNTKQQNSSFVVLFLPPHHHSPLNKKKPKTKTENIIRKNKRILFASADNRLALGKCLNWKRTTQHNYIIIMMFVQKNRKPEKNEETNNKLVNKHIGHFFYVFQLP